MIPITEVRRIIESSFAPLVCSCQVNPGGTLTIEVTDPQSGRTDLLVVGQPLKASVTSREVAQLVAELRAELKANQEWFGRHAQQGSQESSKR